MAAKFLLSSLLLLVLASSLRAEHSDKLHGAMAMAVGENRVQCPSLSQLPFCYRPITNLIRHGSPLSKFCCGIINQISHPCDHLFRAHHWFILSRKNCSATALPPPASPVPRGFQHVAPQPSPAPVFYTAPEVPAPAPADLPISLAEESSAPSPLPVGSVEAPGQVTHQQAHEPKRIAVTPQHGACHESIKRFDVCADNFAGNYIFNNAIRFLCCEAVKDVISACKPEDWPSVPWLLSASDRCINPGHH